MIIGIAGYQRGGKTTAANYMFGCKMLEKEIIKRFNIGVDGELLVNAVYYDQNGNPFEEIAELDIDNKSREFLDYMDSNVYPFIKNYNFADVLKSIAIELYGIKPEQCYGTTEEKLSETQYTWSDFVEVIPKKFKPRTYNPERKVPARQFLQYLGDTLRFINNNCFTTPTIKTIVYEQPSLAIIGDVRQEMEIDAIHENGGKIILLTRKTTDDTHRTERELDTIDRDKFDFIIDNQNMTIDEKNKQVYQIMNSLGLLN